MVTWYTILRQLVEKTSSAKLYQILLIYQERRFLSGDDHRVIDNYREWYIITEWCKSPVVWTLVDCEKLVHFLWKTRTFCYRLVVLISYHKRAARLEDSFLLAAFHFLWTGTTFAFFHSVRNFSLSMYDLNISSKGSRLNHYKCLAYGFWSYHSHGIYSD